MNLAVKEMNAIYKIQDKLSPILHYFRLAAWMQLLFFPMGPILLLPLCAFIPLCFGHGPCLQLNITGSAATITKLENHTSCDWKLTTHNTTLSIAIYREAYQHGVYVSNDENFSNIFWNSRNCNSSENNITKILTEKVIFIRTNSSTPDNSIQVSNYECDTNNTEKNGSINTDFREGQFHVTPVRCRHIISRPKYHTIDLRIGSVQLQTGDNLTIRDDYSEISSIVGPETSEMFRLVNSSYIEVAFESCSMCNRSTPTSLNISWTYCGGIFYDAQNISTTIEEKDTPINVDCLFLLKTDPTKSVAFRLEHYSLTTNTCENDFMQVYDHKYKPERLKWQYCNTSSGDSINSSTNQMVLRLVSSGSKKSITLSGMVVTKEKDCDQVDYYYEGEIVSPANPPSKTCQYTVTTHRQGRILLMFTNFSLPARSNGHCIDYLQVTDVTSNTTQQYCGDAIPRYRLLSGNEAAITYFNGNESDQNSRFQIHFTECGGILSSFSGRIAWKQYSTEIKQPEKCLWKIDNLETTDVYLKFQDNVTHLCNSSLKLTDASGDRTDMLCNLSSAMVHLQGWVQIEMSLTEVLSGFQSISWLACSLVDQSKMGYHIIDLSLYDNINRSCPLKLDAEDIESYIINIENMDHLNCSREIRINNLTYSISEADGIHLQSPVSIHFESNSFCETNQENHIKIQWEACNQTFREPKGTFSSPGYPDQNSVYISCHYTITAHAGAQIYLSFLEFDVGKSRSEKTCGKDRVEISDGLRTDVHCGKRKNDESIQFLSSGSNITVRFVSSRNEGENFKGFLVSYNVFNTNIHGETNNGNDSNDKYLELKRGLLSYRTTLATTIAMGVCIGVLIFIVIALSGFLVRLRKRKGYHNPVLPQPSNEYMANLNGITSQGSRKHGYIKKKDSNSLATPNLKTSRQSSDLNITDNVKKDVSPEENEVYNHLHEEAMKKQTDASKNGDYGAVGAINEEYSKCSRVEKNSVIVGDSEYGHSNATVPRDKIYSFVKKLETSGNQDEQENNEKMYGNDGTTVTDDAKTDKNDDSEASNVGKTDGSNLNLCQHREKGKKEGNREKKEEYINVDRNSNEYGNWREISAHFQETNSRNNSENKVYSNTESIYSNNIDDDVYSNSTSVHM